MPLGVDVILHKQIVLLVTHFAGKKEIATFKSRLKLQCLIILTLELVLIGSCLVHVRKVSHLCSLGSLHCFELVLVHAFLGLSLENKAFDIEKILMLEHILLRQIVNVLVEVIQYLGISQVYDILNQSAILDIHLYG